MPDIPEIIPFTLKDLIGRTVIICGGESEDGEIITAHDIKTKETFILSVKVILERGE